MYDFVSSFVTIIDAKIVTNNLRLNLDAASDMHASEAGHENMHT